MFLNSLNISGSGMTAQRLRMDIISQNLANEDTTNAANGQPYRRKEAVLQETTQTMYPGTGSTQGPGGVEVAAIKEDASPFKLEYDPSSANANASGYVELPNVDTTTEMVDLMSSSRSYEADVTAFNAMKGMATTALDIGK
ncbi:MAG: flagellar basal body rod protein FlgC [Clostridia bacterium]|nr:flagellar basal body rod protein FlgC [Clostridia bacterium]